MLKRFSISHHNQVWIIFGVLVGIVLIGMIFITRSSMVIESSRQAAEKQAVYSRIHSENLKTTSSALRQLDQNLASLLISFSKQFDKNALSPTDKLPPPREDRFPIGDNRFYNHCFFRIDADNQITIRSYQSKKFLARHQDLSKTIEKEFPLAKWADLIPPVLPGSDDYWVIDPEEIYKLNHRISSGGINVNQHFPTKENLQTIRDRLIDGTPEQPDRKHNPIMSRPIAGPILPIWINNQFLLVRRYRNDKTSWIEGSWLDWSRLKSFLEGELRIRNSVSSVPGHASLAISRSATLSLEPYQETLPEESVDKFFSNWFPLRLDIQFQSRQIPVFPADAGRLMLFFGWFCTVVTAIAIGMLLRTVLRIGSHREAFASAVTHELRTPLTTFKLYADLLATNPTAEKTKVYAETLQGEAERLGHLVENVLCYSRVEKRGITSHHRVTSVRDLVQSTEDRLQDHCQKRDAFFDIEISEPSLLEIDILTDPSAVERILLNLADNACKYGRGDDGTFIDMKVTRDKKSLVLEIQDQGPGLAAPQKKRLFKAYNHATISTDSPYTSVGLGLAICYKLAKALGGKLTYRDNQPGCVFSLHLPLQQ